MAGGFAFIIILAVILLLVNIFSKENKSGFKVFFVFIVIGICCLIMIGLLSIFPPAALGLAWPMWYIVRGLLRSLYPERNKKKDTTKEEYNKPSSIYKHHEASKQKALNFAKKFQETTASTYVNSYSNKIICETKKDKRKARKANYILDNFLHSINCNEMFYLKETLADDFKIKNKNKNNFINDIKNKVENLRKYEILVMNRVTQIISPSHIKITGIEHIKENTIKKLKQSAYKVEYTIREENEEFKIYSKVYQDNIYEIFKIKS